MAEDRITQILAELARRVDGGHSSAGLCEVTTDIVGVSGAGVMLMANDVPRGSLCTTDAVSALIEELQYTLGEGPCVDAYLHDRVVLEPDLADPRTPRWPGFSPEAVAAGARAVFGFPLRVGAVRLGALNMYQVQPGALSDDQHANALVMADVVARWVIDVQADAPRACWPRRWSRGASSSSSCTTRRVSSRSNSDAASPKRWSAFAPTPSATAAPSATSPETSSVDVSGSDKGTLK